MTYKLEFLPSARKEWDKLGRTLRDQLKKKLAERLENPRVPADALHGMPDCYKIKLKSSGYRLVYEVIEARIVVSVVAVGKRERSAVYERAKKPR
ncbi:addiction module toxin, RelE/StbE family [Pseudomonas sp. GM78]|uniref:type II toxin-antitoxin system RelE family toxin n=1 Tax=Pseudomonas sp. GM78 TaxID=1144337 RepID=UPI00026FC289|nr:type II toxin-antitoxin system RelE/ParE family toxin [Pseudomonas sp. GM78]EJN31349.1 addiction module toxin, RelE/StbE family [Pseudomonas sp. GM78]